MPAAAPALDQLQRHLHTTRLLGSISSTHYYDQNTVMLGAGAQSRGNAVWQQARAANDFAAFAPALQELPVQELPGQWNRRFKELLGLVPPSDAEGCLQDIHWAEAKWMGTYGPRDVRGGVGAGTVSGCRGSAQPGGHVPSAGRKPAAGWVPAGLRVVRGAAFCSRLSA